MSEFNSDSEFFGTYLQARDDLIRAGWKEGKPNKSKDKISVMFTKNGFAIFVLYGCEEDVKDELL